MKRVSGKRTIGLHRLVHAVLATAFILMFLPQTVSGQDATTPQTWLKFDEAAGATAFADSGSGGSNGACAGDACPTAGAAGRLGQAAQFDGANDRVTVTVNAPAGSFSLAAWVRYTGAAWNDWRTVLEFGDDAPWFGVTPSGQLTLYPAIFGGAVPLGEWTHVAYTWSGTESRLYINGKSVAANNNAPPVGGQGLGLGLEGNGLSAWLGLLDDVRVYARTLSADEMGQLANPEAGPVVVPPPPAPNPNASRLIDVTVSIYRPLATANERQPYEELFRLFADSIFEVTNGAHKIRNVTFYDSGRFADRADIRWIQFEQQPRATLNGYGKGRGTVFMGDAIFDANTLLTNPNSQGVFVNTLAHEWGHYTYGIFDEYSQQAGDTPPEPCSVMCASGQDVNFATLNFSTPKSTAGVNRTATSHYRAFAASGWETVARTPNDDPQAERGRRLYWADLGPKAPAAGQDPSVELPAQRTTARDALNFIWVDANAATPKQRIFLVDVSADMAQNNKLASAKLALNNYVDRASVGDLVGIITFADVHTVVQPLIRIEDDATRATIKAQIDAIQASTTVNDRRGATADAAAIAALQQAGTNGLIVDRGVYTIIDGGFTDVTEPFIFQKLFNDHSAAGIPFSVFNFAAEPKANDLFGNSLELLRFPTTAAAPPGTYQFVGAGGFTIPTRQQVAAEAVSAGELVSALEAADQASSPTIDVNLGTARGQEVAVGEPLVASIYVDSTLDELEVSVLYNAEESAAALSLTDPAGDAASEAPYCDSDGDETLCTFVVSEPLTGTWEFEAAAVATALEVEYAATGYAYDAPTYQATVAAEGGAFVTYPDTIELVAELRLVDRVAGATLTTWVEQPDGTFADLTLTDDGVAPDDLADDGRYSGLLPYTQPGDHVVTILFDNIAGQAFFTQAGMTDVLTPTTSLVADDFDRFATLSILVDDFAADDHGESVDDATDLPADNGDTAGRIDSSGDVDRFRVTSPEGASGDPKVTGQMTAAGMQATARYILRLTHFAFGMDAIVRVTTGSGTNEYMTGVLAYDAYWSLPLDLAAGEVATIEVLHKNGQSAAGQYDISFGAPLSGETTGQASDSIYLPLIDN